MISDNLYLRAEAEGIVVYCGAHLPLVKSVSLCMDGTMFIGIDDTAMETRVSERVHLAHELGHCETKAFYGLYSILTTRGKCERIANEHAIRLLVDEKKLRRLIDSRVGEISIWELSDYFDVTEDFMRMAVEYYYGE